MTSQPTRGVVVAELNDYIKLEISPGSYLLSFVKVWEQNKCHTNAANILKHGYTIKLKHLIKLSLTPTIQSGYATNKNVSVRMCIGNASEECHYIVHFKVKAHDIHSVAFLNLQGRDFS